MDRAFYGRQWAAQACEAFCLLEWMLLPSNLTRYPYLTLSRPGFLPAVTRCRPRPTTPQLPQTPETEVSVPHIMLSMPQHPPGAERCGAPSVSVRVVHKALSLWSQVLMWFLVLHQRLLGKYHLPVSSGQFLNLNP